MEKYHIIKTILLLILVYIQTIFVNCVLCPFEAIVKPYGCECDDDLNQKWLSCQTEQFSDVIKLLSLNLKANEKNFDELYLMSHTLKEVDENFFRNISFKVITFHNCSQLKAIHINAFKHIESDIIAFEISGPNELSDESIFTVISRMINLRSLRLSDTQLSKIPEKAFKPINGLQTNLTRVSFDSLCSHSPIKKVMKHSFAYLPNLIHLDLSCLQIQEIDSYAFEFENSTNRNKLFIDLSDNQLTENSFEQNFFPVFNRSVELILNYNPFKYLNESIFESFLDSNIENKLTIWQNRENSRIDCDSCEVNWFKNFNQQFSDTFCSDGKLLKTDRKALSECPISQNRFKCRN